LQQEKKQSSNPWKRAAGPDAAGFRVWKCPLKRFRSVRSQIQRNGKGCQLDLKERLFVKNVVLFFLLFAYVSVSVAQEFSPAVNTIAPALQPKTKSLNPEYLVFMPEVQEGQKLPLLIFLHGGGGRGNDIHRIKKKSAMSWKGIQNAGKGPCIVVTPQAMKKRKDAPDLSGWIPEELNVFLAHLKATLPVDTSRIYLSGNSMGGYGSWAWGGSNPEHFAAVAPISGGIGKGGPKDISDNIDAWAANLVNVPVYAYAGALDKTVPADRSERMVAAIKEAGGTKVNLFVHPEKGHNMGGLVRLSDDHYDWMFSQQLKEVPNDGTTEK